MLHWRRTRVYHEPMICRRTHSISNSGRFCICNLRLFTSYLTPSVPNGLYTYTDKAHLFGVWLWLTHSYLYHRKGLGLRQRPCPLAKSNGFIMLYWYGYYILVWEYFSGRKPTGTINRKLSYGACTVLILYVWYCAGTGIIFWCGDLLVVGNLLALRNFPTVWCMYVFMYVCTGWCMYLYVLLELYISSTPSSQIGTALRGLPVSWKNLYYKSTQKNKGGHAVHFTVL